MEQQADWWGLQKGLGPRWVMWAPQQWLEQRHFWAWRGASSRICHSKTCQRCECLLPSSAGKTQMHVKSALLPALSLLYLGKGSNDSLLQ